MSFAVFSCQDQSSGEAMRSSCFTLLFITYNDVRVHMLVATPRKPSIQKSNRICRIGMLNCRKFKTVET